MFLLKFIILLVILKLSYALDVKSSERIITTESCTNNPCKNGASCVPLVENGFYCKCMEGFGGKKCEVKHRKLKSLEIKRCDESNCFSGKCGEKDGKAACLCIPGFTGVMCDTKIDPCSNNPCQNEGLCISELNDKFSCLCLPGFIGDTCTEKDPCSTNPCKNDGKCRTVQTGSKVLHTCICESGFYGLNCENENPCSKDPCKNNGLCKFDIENKVTTCTCLKGFKGELCEETIEIENPCELNPCQNGGICKTIQSENGLSHKCECPQTHYGLNCELENPCASMPCKNNGLCNFEVTTNKVSCICLSGFGGEFCNDACEDISKMCTLVPKVSLCSTMGSQCKKSCGLCGK